MWTAVDPNRKAYISYLGPLPAHLYRYRSVNADNFERLVAFEILDEAIYLAGLDELNDPDEGRFTISFGTDYLKILEYWRMAIKNICPELTEEQVETMAVSNTDEIANSGYKVADRVIFKNSIFEQLIRVACFTTQPTNYSMWANYAKYSDPSGCDIGHAGICIEYQCDESWRNTALHPVEYTDVIPEINVVDRIESDLVKAMYMKAREWRGEEEWRITSTLNAKPPFSKNFANNSKIKMENAVASVIFGLKTPDSLIDKFRSRITHVKPNITFKKVAQDTRKYARKIIDL